MHATTSPKIIDQQPAALAILAAVVLGIGIALGAVMDIDLRIASAPAAIAAPDTSYDAVEGARAQFGVKDGEPATQPDRDGRYGHGYR